MPELDLDWSERSSLVRSSFDSVAKHREIMTVRRMQNVVVGRLR